MSECIGLNNHEIWQVVAVNLVLAVINGIAGVNMNALTADCLPRDAAGIVWPICCHSHPTKISK